MIYRIYWLSEGDRIHQAEYFESEADLDAVERAWAQIGEYVGVEVWEGKRRIAKLMRRVDHQRFDPAVVSPTCAG